MNNMLQYFLIHKKTYKNLFAIFISAFGKQDSSSSWTNGRYTEGRICSPETGMSRRFLHSSWKYQQHENSDGRQAQNTGGSVKEGNQPDPKNGGSCVTLEPRYFDRQIKSKSNVFDLQQLVYAGMTLCFNHDKMTFYWKPPLEVVILITL